MPDIVEAIKEKSLPHEAYRIMEENKVYSCLSDSLNCAMVGFGDRAGFEGKKKGCFFRT